MPSKPQVTAKINADATGMQKSLRGVKKQFQGLAREMGNSMKRAMAVGMAGAAAGMAAALKRGFDQKVILDQTEIITKAMLGSAEKARLAMKMISDEAKQNPMFSKSELAESAQALAGFADKSVFKLGALVGVAQRLSVLKPSAGLMGAVEALRDAMGGETERLKEFGFSGKELTDMKMRAGAGGDLAGAISKALTAKGITGAAVGELTNSVDAQMQNLSNQFTDLGENFFTALWPDLSKNLTDLTNVITSNKDAIISGMQTVVSGISNSMWAIGKAAGIFDKITESVAGAWYDNDPGMIDKLQVGLGQVADIVSGRKSISDSMRDGDAQLYGAKLGERGKELVAAKQQKQQATIRIDMQGFNGVPGMMSAS